MRLNKELYQLGVDPFHGETLEWRPPDKEEIKSGTLVGEDFRIGRRMKRAKTYLHNCLGSIWVGNREPAIIKYKYGELESGATLFKLPTRVQKTKKEVELEIAEKYPNSTLYIPNTGCQMHGDIAAELTLENGDRYRIPWNY